MYFCRLFAALALLFLGPFAVLFLFLPFLFSAFSQPFLSPFSVLSWSFRSPFADLPQSIFHRFADPSTPLRCPFAVLAPSFRNPFSTVSLSLALHPCPALSQSFCSPSAVFSAVLQSFRNPFAALPQPISHLFADPSTHFRWPFSPCPVISHPFPWLFAGP